MTKLSDAAKSLLAAALKARSELCERVPAQEAEYINGLELIVIVVDSRISRCEVKSYSRKVSTDLLKVFEVIRNALVEYERKVGAQAGKRFLNDFFQNEN